MMAPSVSVIQSGVAVLRETSKEIMARQRVELAGFGLAGLKEIGVTEYNFDVTRGYELGLATMRAMLKLSHPEINI